MAELGSQGVVKDRPMSRIENDVETTKGMTLRIEDIASRISRHARNLGYFEPTPSGSAASAPTPVVTTLADALNALDRAIDHCSGGLNVFD